jgi:biotin synthase
MKHIEEVWGLTDDQLIQQADAVRRKAYGMEVYIRGLVEVSNYCQKNCLYCGINAGNRQAERYRLDKETIMNCCNNGYRLGFRTFVLQGGEDTSLTDAWLCDLISAIKANHPDCAVSLSLGEKPKQSYQAYFNAGADRYLLRHETADPVHYAKLHPGQSIKARKQCLFNLKEIGYEVGSGFLVGSPGQTDENLREDLRFLQELQPDMIGIGPFIPHKDTVFAEHPKGDINTCIRFIAILRLLFPHALIPATTALASLHPQGRIMGLQAGANVVMPNLSPDHARARYRLYDNKLNTGAESAEGLDKLKKEVAQAGYQVVTAIGSVKRGFL